MQVWPWSNFTLLAFYLGKPGALLSDQQLFGIDKRCPSESVITGVRESFLKLSANFIGLLAIFYCKICFAVL